MSWQLGQTPGQVSALAIRTTLGHNLTGVPAAVRRGGGGRKVKKKVKRFDCTWEGPNLNLNKRITETGTPKPLSAFAAALGGAR